MSATNPKQELYDMENGINLINSTLDMMKFQMRMLQEENEKLKNVICHPLISCNGINCKGKEKFIKYRIKEYEELIWKIENGKTSMGDFK